MSTLDEVSWQRTSLRTAYVATTLASPAIAAVIFSLNKPFSLCILASIPLTAAGIIATSREGGYRRWALGYVALTFLLAAIGMAVVGPNVASALGYVALVVMSGVFLGPRALWIAAALVGSATFAIGAVHLRGALSEAPTIDWSLRSPWYSVALAFAAFTAMLCAPVAKLLLLYERGLAGRGSVLAALDDEREAHRRATLAFEQTEVALAISQRVQLASALGAAIAHRINDALTIVRCWAEALRAGAPDAQERKLASSAITAAARRLSLLTRKLMSIALPARGGRDVTDVRKCFDELAPLCKQVLRADVHLDILLEGALYVRLGEAQLEQVLLNLVLNAADAMPAGGRLEIAAALDREGRIVLRVSDTGQFRGGLGLAPVQKIVTAAGGRIDVRSGVGSGTAVTVSLPSAESAGAVEGWSGRVLLVEREDDVRRLAADALRERGFAVLDEPNVARALDRVRRLRVRLDLLCIGCSVSADGLAALVDELFALHAGARVLVCDRLELAAPLRPFMTGRRIALMPEPFAATDLAERAYTLIEGEPVPRSEAT